MMMSFMQTQQPSRKMPESRSGRVRPSFLQKDVLARAIEQGESQLAREIEQMRGECQR